MLRKNLSIYSVVVLSCEERDLIQICILLVKQLFLHVKFLLSLILYVKINAHAPAVF